jgi:hypothetical protein
LTQTNTNQQAIAAMKNVMEVTLAKIKNAHTLMWIFIRVKWSFISNVKMDLNGKKHGHTKGVIILINTDKYEGHTEGEWRVDDEIGLVIKWGDMPHDFVDMENKANAQLMADAPLLLEEVKRLRKERTFLWEIYLKESAEVKRLREMVRFLEEDLTHDNYCVLHDKGMCDMLTRIPCYICEQEEE